MFSFDTLTSFVKTAVICGLVGVTAVIAIVRFFIEGKKGVCKCTARLDGKVALVTGGNTGIGFEAAKDLASRGARVIIASRDTKKSKTAVEEIIRSTGNKNVEYRVLDLSKFSSVREFAEEFNRTEKQLHILVNNAGLGLGDKRPTADGYNMVIQVNYLSAFLLTNLLLDKLIASKPSRIVIVSSVLHRLAYFNPNDLGGVRKNPLTRIFSYNNSKFLQILWLKALCKRLPEGVTVNALHPGIVKTDIYNALPSWYQMIVKAIIGIVFKDPKEGAQSIIHLSVAPELEQVTGQYYADCRVAKISPRAKNSQLVERVWKQSVELTSSK